MTWNLKEMSLKWKIIALAGSFIACAAVLAGAFKLLKMLGVL